MRTVSDVRLETDSAKRAVVVDLNFVQVTGRVDWCIEPVERAADGDWKNYQSTVILKQSVATADCVNCTVAGDLQQW